MKTVSRIGLGTLVAALLCAVCLTPIASVNSDRRQSQTAVVKERLRVAAAISVELATLAEASGSEKLPRESHLARYAAARPWASLWSGGTCDRFVSAWPTETDGPALRALLADDDPKLRGLALEALATLRLPEDVPRMARLLEDQSPAAPLIQGSGRSSFVSFGGSRLPANPDPFSQLYSWYPSTVAAYAQRALQTITGATLDAKTFGAWWRVNHLYQQRLWYWNLRIRRAVIAVERRGNEESQPATQVNAEELKRLQSLARTQTKTRLAELRRQFTAEAMLLEPEVAAKILLLAAACENGGDHSYFESLSKIPLSAARLLELLDEQRLWPDIDWAADSGLYNRMVHQIMLASPPAFGPEHVAQLRAIFVRRKGQMWWSAEGPMFVGISRLLPNANGKFDQATREGYLRESIEGRGDLFARNMAAAELARVDLPRQWPYLKAILFAQPRVPDYPDLVQTIIRSLGECPITAAKRDALLELLNDSRIKPLLKQAEDRYRYYLGWTIREQLAQDNTAPAEVFDSRSGNPVDALPEIVESLKARAKLASRIEPCG